MAEKEQDIPDKKSEDVRISVRSLVEFIRRSGDIDTRSGSSFDTEAMLAGGRAHRKIQKGMAGDYQAEMSLKDLIDCGGYQIKIEGRADGVFTEKTDTEGIRRFAVDEIKGIYADPDSLTEPVPVHLAQAKCYAAIILKQLPEKDGDFREQFGIAPGTEMSGSEIGVRMTYVHLEENERIRRFSFIFKREEIFGWYEELIADFKKWTDMQNEWERKRDLSMEPLSFPFEYRKGQKVLVSSVYHTIREKKELFLMAPTGTGKTMAVVYPSVRAIGQGIAERIFYLTAKNQTHHVAEEAFGILKDAGLSMRTITITAKEKICPMNEVSCNPDDCPHAKGHFDRINEAVFDLLSEKEVFDRETISEWAEKRNVCPFELGLDVSSWCDAVICDYNYAFDPNAHLVRFFGEGKKSDAIFLIDEAHNLVDRAREMYSAELVKEDVLKARNLVKDVNRKAYRALSRVNKTLLELRKTFDAEVPDAGRERWMLLPESGNLITEAVRAFGELQVFFKEERDASCREDLLDFYFQISGFVSTYEAMDDDYVTYAFADEKGHFHVRLFCVNPARRLGEMIERGRSAIFFSATLLPVGYYKKLLSLKEDAYTVYAESSFKEEQRLILVGGDVSTRMRSRGKAMYRRIASYIHETVTAHRGNYMAFFPSYKFMEDVLALYREEFDEPDVNWVAQSRYMGGMDREIFLENFYEAPEMSLIGFCVMGGIFAEGIDLTGSRLVGAIVVGCGLPQVGAETELLRSYYEEKDHTGFASAYLYPGMNKVLQSAGRVIRTATDRGIILLLDDRFLSRDCLGMFPREWRHFISCREGQAGALIRDFWEKADGCTDVYD